MKITLLSAALFAMVATPMTAPVAATAQSRDRDYDRDGNRYRDRDRDRNGRADRRWNGDDRNWDASRSYREGNYRERRLTRNDRVYRGQDGRTYCRRNDGTTGLVVGGLAGGVLGNVIGGGTLGTLLGAGGGALLGRSVDRGNVKCR